MDNSNSLYAEETFGILDNITIDDARECLKNWVDELAERAELGHAEDLVIMRFLDRMANRDTQRRINESIINDVLAEYGGKQ